MKVKLICGVVAVIIGIVLLGYGFYGRSEMAKARGDIDSATSWIPQDDAKGIVSGGLNRKVDAYGPMVMWLFIGGVIFVVGGGITIWASTRSR